MNPKSFKIMKDIEQLREIYGNRPVVEKATIPVDWNCKRPAKEWLVFMEAAVTHGLLGKI